VELDLTADQRPFRSSARSLLEEEHSLDRICDLADGETPWTRDWWGRAAELGWTAALVAEELGGGSVSGAGESVASLTVWRAGVFLSRQSASLRGGSSEMARNGISERLLGMPRERSDDRDVPFNQARRGRS
jgi:alkylation response protein AidB-like acyl-CoA dehydrogenase